MKIESLTNAHVKELVKLKSKKYRDETGLFLIEGDHLIKAANKEGLIKEIISIVDLNADFYVTKEIMKKISNQVSISSNVAVCYKIKEKPFKDNLVILDNIQDPGNLGTIIRSAVAFGIDTLVLSNDTVDLYNDKVIRASEGMIFSLNVIRRDIEEFLKEISNNYQILITDVKKGENIKNISHQTKIALVIGNEGNGVNENLKKYAHNFVKIKMNPACESLNASIAASILMYEIRCHNE